MDVFDDEISRVKESGLYRSLRSLSSPQGPEIEIDGKKVLNFCSNDYLGLANDLRLKKAAVEAVERFGTGSGAARLISGNFELADALEAELARFKGTESALLFNSGYHANVGVIPALAGEGDTILSDELNHASLIDGCRLSKAEKVVYRHHDLNHLEGLLKIEERGNPRRRKLLIVTEAIFSMEGDVCLLADLLQLAQKYGALVYLDEAHAVGVLGENGEGLAPRNPAPYLITMGTLGKAFGSYGAFVCGPKSIKEFLINKARSFIFTTALPPAVLGASSEALKVVQNEPERRRTLWRHVRSLRTSFGFPEGAQPSPIFSIPVGPAEETMRVSQTFFEKGIYLQGIRPPTVPEGTSRLRLTVTAAHTEGQLEKLVTESAWILKN